MAESAGAQEEQRVEQECLKGKKDADLGVYCRLCSAKTPIEGQDGGVVTSLLINGLKDGTFDAAIVVKRTQGYNAEAFGTSNPEEVLAAKGTKYLKVNILPKLRELAEQGKRKIAIACTPCQARAVRNIERTLKQTFPNLEITVIGLFCLEAFNATKLKEEAKLNLGVDLDKAEKTQIRKGKFYAYIDGQEFSCKIRDLSDAAEKSCHFCSDFTSRLADVSVGSVGSKQGYSTVIVRSDKGERLLKSLDATMADVDREEIVKLSRFKAERAQKSHLALKSSQ